MRTRIKPGRIAGFLAQMMLLLAPTVSLAEVCANTIQADVVAIDQQIVHNRLGAFNPISMIFALRQDVVNAANGLTEAEGEFSPRAMCGCAMTSGRVPSSSG